MFDQSHIKLTLLLYPVFISFFWVIVFLLNKTSYKTPRYILMMFMLVSGVVYTTHLFLFMDIRPIYIYLDSIYTFFSLLMFPLYFIYVRLLIVDEKVSFRVHFPFFYVPLLILTLYLFGILMMSPDEHYYYLFHVLRYKESSDGIVSYMFVVYWLSRLLFVGQGVYFLVAGFQLTHKNKTKIDNYYANSDDGSYNKVSHLNITLLVGMSLGIIATVIGKEQFLFSNVGLSFVTLSIGSMLFTVGWIGSNQRPILVDKIRDQYDDQKNEYFEIVDSGSLQMQYIRKKINHLFEEDKIYLNKELTLWDLSRIIGTNRTYVSTIINTDFDHNFSTFVNSYRIEYAKNLLKHNPVIQNQDLAEASGFGSVASLTRSFQQQEGISLKEYRKIKSIIDK